MCRMELTNEAISLVTMDDNIKKDVEEEEKSFDSHIPIKVLASILTEWLNR